MYLAQGPSRAPTTGNSSQSRFDSGAKNALSAEVLP